MEFCMECGSRLTPQKIRSGSQATIMLSCVKCGHKKPDAELKLTNGKVIKHSPKQFVAVIDREMQELYTMPTLQVKCPRCGYNNVNVWLVQTRGSDESSTQFLRCTSCSFSFREYT